jgi:hypothetical protein
MRMNFSRSQHRTRIQYADRLTTLKVYELTSALTSKPGMLVISTTARLLA